MRRRVSFILVTIFFVSWFIFTNQAKGQQQLEESQITYQRPFDALRTVISTSGPVKFGSYWLNDPPRLVVEFKSRNVVSKIDKEVDIAQGVIKRITSSYFAGGQTKSLKALTFELSEKVPYKIWQENNAIILEIQAPLKKEYLAEEETLVKSVSSVDSKEIFITGETQEVIERLEAMDTALTKVGANQLPLEEKIAETELSSEPAMAEVIKKTDEGIDEAEMEITLPKDKPLPVLSAEPPKARKSMMGMVLGFVSLALISGLGFFIWRRRRSNVEEKLKKFKRELQGKNKIIEQEETLRKAVEKVSLQKEREYQELRSSFDSLKAELNRTNERLVNEENTRKKMEGAALQKEREYVQLKNAVESLKLELQEKNERLVQEENTRKAIEEEWMRKDEEYEQLKKSFEFLQSERQEQNRRFEQEEVARKTMEEALLQKEKEYQELKNSFESLKEEFIKKEPAEKVSGERNEEQCAPGESQGRRAFPRSALTKDFTKTIVLRIGSPNMHGRIKCFAENISSGGLSFETTEEFEENDPINLRLFFYGEQAPMVKVKAHIVWKKRVGEMNYYGVSFDSITEEDKNISPNIGPILGAPKTAFEHIPQT